MSDTFLPGSGFDTYETQDKALIALDGTAVCSAAVRILQQQGFGVTGAALRLAGGTDAAVEAARQAAKRLGIECVTLDARELCTAENADTVATLTALSAAADKLGIQYISAARFARVEPDADGAGHIAPCIRAEDDESAQLAALPPELLVRLLLPLGEFGRKDIYELIKELGIE